MMKPNGDMDALQKQVEAEQARWTPRSEINAAMDEHPLITQIKGLLGVGAGAPDTSGRAPDSIRSDYFDSKYKQGVINTPQHAAALAMEKPGPHSEEEMDNADRAELASLSTDDKPDEARISELVKPRNKRKK